MKQAAAESEQSDEHKKSKLEKHIEDRYVQSGGAKNGTGEGEKGEESKPEGQIGKVHAQTKLEVQIEDRYVQSEGMKSGADEDQKESKLGEQIGKVCAQCESDEQRVIEVRDVPGSEGAGGDVASWGKRTRNKLNDCSTEVVPRNWGKIREVPR